MALQRRHDASRRLSMFRSVIRRRLRLFEGIESSLLDGLPTLTGHPDTIFDAYVAGTCSWS